MKKENIKFISVVVVLALAGALALSLHFKNYAQKDTIDINKFPFEFNGWKGEAVEITEEEYAILETRNVFARRYFKEDKEVLLLVSYSETNRKVIHPPEICYTGSGLTIVNKTKDSFHCDDLNQDVEINKLQLEQNKETEIAVYWFKAGGTYTGSYIKHQILLSLYSLLGKPHSGAMIRVSALVKDENQEQALSDIKEFSNSLAPLVLKYMP